MVSLKKRFLGFTLIEVLLAISIFAVISLASFSIFDGVLKSENMSEEKMQRLNDIQRAWLIIERDFLQIAQRTMRIEGEAPSSTFIHASADSFLSDSQSIAFVRQGWTNPGLLIPRSDVQSVAYRVEEETLERLHYNFVDAVSGEEPKVRKLIKGVKTFDIEYFYQKKWQTAIQDNAIIQAILLRVETEDLGVIERKFIVPEFIKPAIKATENNATQPGGDNPSIEQANSPSNSPEGDER